VEEVGTPKVLAVVQARTGSSRLPGKVLLPIFDNKCALELMLERVCRAKTVDKIAVATTPSTIDDRICELCEQLGYECFRGSEDDVLDRYYKAVLALGPAEVIVRLTGDCPLHDPAIIDKVVMYFLDSNVDYVNNANPPTYPDGLDVEVFSFATLKRAWQEARLKSEREHVTSYIYKHPDVFKIADVKCERDLSDKRWTLDEQQDYEFIKLMYKNLYKKSPGFGMEEILGFLAKHPEFEQINKHLSRNEGYQKSLEEDNALDLSGKEEC